MKRVEADTSRRLAGCRDLEEGEDFKLEFKVFIMESSAFIQTKSPITLFDNDSDTPHRHRSCIRKYFTSSLGAPGGFTCLFPSE